MIEEKDSTTIKIPANAHIEGNKIFFDMDADDVKEAYENTSHWSKLMAETREMTTRKENLQKQVVLFGGYFATFMLISIAILVANSYWNNVVRLTGKGKKRNIRLRYTTYTVLIIATFIFDLITMMFNGFERPYALFGVGAFVLYNVIEIIVVSNKKHGVDDSRLKDIGRQIAKKVSGVDIPENNNKEEDEL